MQLSQPSPTYWCILAIESEAELGLEPNMGCKALWHGVQGMPSTIFTAAPLANPETFSNDNTRTNTVEAASTLLCPTLPSSLLRCHGSPKILYHLQLKRSNMRIKVPTIRTLVSLQISANQEQEKYYSSQQWTLTITGNKLGINMFTPDSKPISNSCPLLLRPLSEQKLREVNFLPIELSFH